MSTTSTASNTATLTGFLTVGVAMITAGSDLVKDGQYGYGIALLVIGIALIALGTYLFQRGIIPQVARALKSAGAAVARIFKYRWW